MAPPGSRDGNFFYIYKEPETVHTDPLKETQIQDLNDPMDSRSYDDEKWDDLPDPVVKPRNLDNLSSPVNDGRKYHVVVGSYENQKNALLRVRKLKSLGFQPSVIPTDTGKFRVSCAFYDSRDEAKSALEKLKVEHNIEGWIYSIE
ncbi:MAG: SPOR domain-containing protein [Bacteroidia bacterium]